jgi:hypothetical protein
VPPLPVHGFSSVTAHDLAPDDDGRTLIIFYVGDYRGHVIRRIARMEDDLGGLPSFPTKDKQNDPRHKWFARNYGKRCLELDAMDPNDLRDRVEEAIRDEIEWDAWERSARCQDAEEESLQSVLDKWGKKK